MLSACSKYGARARKHTQSGHASHGRGHWGPGCTLVRSVIRGHLLLRMRYRVGDVRGANEHCAMCNCACMGIFRFIVGRVVPGH
jgi:hypothetical protein